MTTLACLLPARNAEDDLPDALASIERFADVVIALDDGSIDATPDLLAGHPLVRTLLRHPRRSGYAGWEDGTNRNELLAAAIELAPDWVLFLDADERIAPDDAAALRRFLAGDALAGCAYGLRCYRFWGEDRHDPEPHLVYRLFAPRPGQRLSDQDLHFNPVPTDIPRSAWVPTTLRLQHLGVASPERIEGRLRKYRAADPQQRHRVDFGAMDRPPERTVPWAPRPKDLPVLEVLAAASELPDRDGAPRVVALLPVRNAAVDLPGWLESASRVADVAIALDDGSVDATAAMLESSPFVARVLRNPRRAGYAGWDDRGNRAVRLLAECRAGRPPHGDIGEAVLVADACDEFVDKPGFADAGFADQANKLG